MRIQRLELKNIGCFGRADFEFGEATLIFGENRTGKSTLVYALFFALFGRHLNAGLTLKDLCTKGEPSGGTHLFFKENGSEYRLHQSTDGLPTLHERSNPDSEWRPVKLTDSEDLRGLIPLTPETAALTAFFRESELIYFLQDIPKYNKTLLQSLIGMDDILILKSRFKKALAKAREFRKGVSKVTPPSRPDSLEIELARRQLAKAESSLQEIESEYQASIQSKGQPPAVTRLLQQQYEEKRTRLEQARAQRKRHPSFDELKQKRSEIQGRLSAAEAIRRSADALQHRIGSNTREADQIRTRMDKLSRLERNSTCPLCEQELPARRLTEMLQEMEKRSAALEKDRQLLEKEVAKNQRLERDLESAKNAVQDIEDQIRRLQELERSIGDLENQVKGLKSDLSSFESHRIKTDGSKVRENTLAEGSPFQKKPERLETRRREAQEAVIHNKVLLRQYEERIQLNKENRENLDIAERNVLICATACQAFEEAVQMLGGRMLERVRRSIEIWSRHFTFLHRFDIQMTDRELLPIIQAKGYHYKLNQMSKSERIFLYLMLKLSIGEALGHLGLFILDDPADGLDHKRKQTLAYLLAEVAKKRQVIVTTNDPVFAELFPKAGRINL